MLCFSLCLAIFGSQLADYLLSLRAEPVPIAARITADTADTAEPPLTRGLPPTAEMNAGKIDVNTATAADFQRVSGIGPKLAQAILDARDIMGGFRFLEELMDVNGIGEKRFAALKELFYCQESQE